MKKIILTAVAVFAFGFANAQITKFGLKGGLNIANQSFSGTDMPSPSSNVGFHVGGFVEIEVSDKFSVQPELLYSTQGSKFSQMMNINGTNYNVDAKFNLSYLNVPVMMKYYAAEKFSLEAGPQIGFLTSAKVAVTVLGNSNSQDVKDNFKSVDFGLNFGAGYDFTDHVSAGIRYNVGLANVAKTEAGDNTKIKNNVFSLSLGYKF